MPATADDHSPIAEHRAAPEVRELLGAPVPIALGRFGRAVADRRVGEDRWLRFEGPGWSMRLRARPGKEGDAALIRSWTVAFAHGFNTVADAMGALGLPVPEPLAGTATLGDLRQPLRDEAGRVHSLTAAVRAGRVRAVSGFDESPDW